MELQILVRGQSNAVLFAEGDHYAAMGRLVTNVQTLLGFDGVNDTVKTIYKQADDQSGTARGATAFLGDWMQAGADGIYHPAALENGVVRAAAELHDPAAVSTAVLWLHSEYDSTHADLSPGTWMAAVRQDAALVRSALGGDAASVPYEFVSAHPYGSGTGEGHQAIRLGMEALANDPGFHARIAARALDIDASLDNQDGDWTTTEYGGGHIVPSDATLIADRAARTIAEDWAAYAKPGSPVALAGGDIADAGPRVVSADAIGPATLRLEVAQDQGGGFAPLDADAAHGIGWGVAPGDGLAPQVSAVSAVVQDPDTIDVTFAAPLPAAGGVLHYGWGYGRLADNAGPAHGNAITDEAGLPIWTPATGIHIGAPAVPTDDPWLA